MTFTEKTYPKKMILEAGQRLIVEVITKKQKSSPFQFGSTANVQVVEATTFEDVIDQLKQNCAEEFTSKTYFFIKEWINIEKITLVA